MLNPGNTNSRSSSTSMRPSSGCRRTDDVQCFPSNPHARNDIAWPITRELISRQLLPSWFRERYIRIPRTSYHTASPCSSIAVNEACFFPPCLFLLINFVLDWEQTDGAPQHHQAESSTDGAFETLPALKLWPLPASSAQRWQLNRGTLLSARARKKSFLFSALYAAFIFGGRHLMNKRAKFELRKPLVLWSLSLAVFSIFGAVRTGAYMLYILMTKGLKQSVCDQSFYIGPVSKFWAYAFVLSKAPELGDTIFIILRKQKLIFLHWYHHITVLLYSWYSYKDMVAGGGWFMTMNYGVHAVMYSYYALRAAGFRVSRKFAMFITLSQITQMLIGCVINYLVFSWMQQGQCHSHVQNIIWSSLMYLSYFVLFCHFFFEAYIGKTRKERKVD
ncbi:very long chain fatty acid elongase 6 isoform X1 [Mycteria americana]|uniref:very long chain fatty acid elongase 6 isoform X1 n=1 Tax=Mycteria americana TaxID=33587 RepID=UPI003F587900